MTWTYRSSGDGTALDVTTTGGARRTYRGRSADRMWRRLRARAGYSCAECCSISGWGVYRAHGAA